MASGSFKYKNKNNKKQHERANVFFVQKANFLPFFLSEL
jgi:hypothetical protein